MYTTGKITRYEDSEGLSVENVVMFIVGCPKNLKRNERNLFLQARDVYLHRSFHAFFQSYIYYTPNQTLNNLTHKIH
jgi:hypothetical protein